jgi:hypothetical protein
MTDDLMMRVWGRRSCRSRAVKACVSHITNRPCCRHRPAQDTTRPARPAMPAGAPVHHPFARASLAAAVIAAGGDMDYYDMSITDADSSVRSGGLNTTSYGLSTMSSDSGLGALERGPTIKARVAAGVERTKGCFAKYGPLAGAMLMCQAGMILFNFGLTYGFSCESCYCLARGRGERVVNAGEITWVRPGSSLHLSTIPPHQLGPTNQQSHH